MAEPAMERTLALAGRGLQANGVAIVPGYATALTDRRRIRSKRIEKPVVEREVLMVHRSGPTLSPAAEAFAQFVVEHTVQAAAPRRARGSSA